MSSDLRRTMNTSEKSNNCKVSDDIEANDH